MIEWNPSFDTRFKPSHQPEGRGRRREIKDRIIIAVRLPFLAVSAKHTHTAPANTDKAC
jgi:hypothetical protein